MGWFTYAYIFANWTEFVGYLEDMLPPVMAAVQEEFLTELTEAINAGEVTYQELDEALQTKIDAIVSIEWPQGISYEQDDLVQVIPDHIYLTYPGTELIICDLIDITTWLASIPWNNIVNITFQVLGEFWDTSFLGTMFNFLLDAKIPWSDEFLYRDSTTGVVQKGNLFNPEKNLHFRSVILKGLAIALIVWLVKKTGMFSKIWSSLKGLKAYTNRKLVRDSLTSLLGGQADLDTLINTRHTTILETIEEMRDTVEPDLTEIQLKLIALAKAVGLKLTL